MQPVFLSSTVWFRDSKARCSEQARGAVSFGNVTLGQHGYGYSAVHSPPLKKKQTDQFVCFTFLFLLSIDLFEG